MNKLRKLLSPTEEERKLQRKVVEGMWEEMVREKRCCTCSNTYREERYEMGKKSGYITRCRIDGEVKVGGMWCEYYCRRGLG